ncbi:MAG: GNAT family N-acetyltransferase [Gaiellaceae bacterium]
MSDEARRAWAFMRRADARGTDERPFAFGTAVLTPELPKRYDSNFLYVDELRSGTSAAELAAASDRVFRDAGLEHRALVFPHAQDGERLAPAFPGWDVHRNVVMVQRRPPDELPDTSTVEELDEAALRPARRAQILTYPWGSPDVAEQLLDARTLLARWVSVRCFAVHVGGEVVSYTDLYAEGDEAQIEDVATAEAHRGRGYAKAVVIRAVQEARAGGAEFVFLVADEADWPKELYRRLGFETVGRYVKLYRPTSARSE